MFDYARSLLFEAPYHVYALTTPYEHPNADNEAATDLNVCDDQLEESKDGKDDMNFNLELTDASIFVRVGAWGYLESEHLRFTCIYVATDLYM
jgi:hypothetical protein